MIGEAIADIHADPHLAQECNIDIRKYCDHTLEEEGKGVLMFSVNLTSFLFIELSIFYL